MSIIEKEYIALKKTAETKGWHIPKVEAFGMAACINYWKQCNEHEKNPENGRPIRPHRSA